MSELGLMDFIKDAKSRIEEVDVDTAESLIQSGYKVLDVREPAEFLSGAIEGTIHIPRGLLEVAADRQFPGASPQLRDGRDDKWLVLCRTGGRAAMATDLLTKMGFSDIKNILGGYDAWVNANKATVIPSDDESLVKLKQPCLKV